MSRIHVVFKTHLDIGFSELAATVVDSYMDRLIPQAMTLAERMRRGDGPGVDGHTNGSGDRFIWTTGSWLISEYLDRADSAGRRRMEEAILNGDIAWHALPFSMFSEAMDASLFEFGLGLSATLDNRFGKKTIAAKMTDVPGHTRGIVPLLAAAGVEFLHIGVNAASRPPDVPPLFVWRDPGTGAEVVVMYQGNYGDLMIVPGLAEGLALSHTDDNVGPQSIDQVRSIFSRLRNQFPDADVQASTMDAFARHLPTIRERLPIVTKEIGDTWIHGIASDPAKQAAFRALVRMRRAHLDAGTPPESLRRFSANLLLVPEHTDGLDVKTHLKDWTTYRPDDLRQVRQQGSFAKLESSWQEQRDYLDAAIASLPGELQAEARATVAETRPSRPVTDDYEPMADVGAPIELPQFTIAFDETSGYLKKLESAGIEWAGPRNPIGRFWYEVFSAEDYRRFRRQYLINKRSTSWYAVPDFTKPGIDELVPEHREFVPAVRWAGRRPGGDSDSFLLLMDMPAESWESFGAARELSLEVTFSRIERVVDFRLQWFRKTASRLPEAAWFSFVPSDPDDQFSGTWRMDKLGQWISPKEIVRNGNRHLHGVGLGVQADDGRRRLAIESLDAPLVAPGRPSLLDFNNRQPDLHEGLHFNLHNNTWGTDFPQWYDDDALFRFTLRFPS